jgi:hypothetical protein
MLPLDYEIHVFDLEYANKEDKPLWKLKYDYRPLFDMKDLSPESMYDVSKQFLLNATQAKMFRNMRY